MQRAWLRISKTKPSILSKNYVNLSPRKHVAHRWRICSRFWTISTPNKISKIGEVDFRPNATSGNRLGSPSHTTAPVHCFGHPKAPQWSTPTHSALLLPYHHSYTHDVLILPYPQPAGSRLLIVIVIAAAFEDRISYHLSDLSDLSLAVCDLRKRHDGPYAIC